MAQFWPFDMVKMTFRAIQFLIYWMFYDHFSARSLLAKLGCRAIQPKSFLSYIVNVIPKKLHAKKEKKLLKRFWDWPLPPLNLDRQKDGQLGIRKAPLPFGTAELKSSAAFWLAELKNYVFEKTQAVKVKSWQTDGQHIIRKVPLPFI